MGDTLKRGRRVTIAHEGKLFQPASYESSVTRSRSGASVPLGNGELFLKREEGAIMILITGASGNVGSEVLKQAMAAKLKLTAAYQSAEKAQSAPGNVHTVVLDYEKPETIRAALEGVDILKEGLILLRGRKRSARPKWLRNSREQRDAPSAMSI